MKKSLLAAAVAAVAFAPTAFADNYQHEVGLGTSIIDDKGVDKKDNVYGIDYEFFFSEVDTEGKPLNEAAFLGHNGGIQASYQLYDDKNNKLKHDFLSLGADYWFGDFYLGGGLDFNMPEKGSDTTDVNLKFGYMVLDNLRIHLGVDVLEDADVDKKGKEKNLNVISIGTKYVAQFDYGAALNIEANIARDDADDRELTYFDLDVDYYFNNAVSAGISYEATDESGAKPEFGINAKWFVIPKVSLEAVYWTQAKSKKLGTDKENAVALRAAMRF